MPVHRVRGFCVMIRLHGGHIPLTCLFLDSNLWACGGSWVQTVRGHCHACFWCLVATCRCLSSDCLYEGVTA